MHCWNSFLLQDQFIGFFTDTATVPKVDCDYQPPDVCTQGAPPMTPVNLLLVATAAITAAVMSSMWA